MAQTSCIIGRVIAIDYTQLRDNLWVGSYPQQPEDVFHLQKLGVTAVLNLQSDEDFASRGISWSLFWKFYVSRNIHVVRFPIIDFEPAALRKGLPGAVDALEELLSGGYRVYLHCTAGVNRSPTVAIAWMDKFGGMTLEAAESEVKSLRPKVYPYPEVMSAWKKLRP